MGDSYRALESLLPLLKTQVWGKAGKDGTEGVCGGQRMGSLEHPFNFFFLFLKYIYLFIYFWLCWVFVAVRGLSLVAASGGHSWLQCTGLSLWWLVLLWNTGSRRTGCSSCGAWAQQLQLAGSRAQAQ